jgi:hypothetical protein
MKTPFYRRLVVVNQTLRNEGKLRKEDIMVKNFKRIFIVVSVVGFILLVQGCGTDPAVWAAIGQGINSGLSGGSSSGSSSSYSGSSSSTTTLSGTYYGPLNISVTFYRDGTWDYDAPFMYSYGSYSVSGTRITMYEDHSGDVLYWTIVSSTTIRDNSGNVFSK